MQKIIEKFDESTDFNNSRITLVSAVLLFYMTASTSPPDSLLSQRMSDLLEDNRYAQHIMAFLRLFVTIVLIANITNTKTALLYSIIAYVWFILTTKLDLEWNLVILILLVFGFVFENQMLDEENHYKDDPLMTEIEKKRLMDKHHRYRAYIVLSLIFLTLVGTAIYLGKKKGQYGGNFNFIQFFFGRSNRI